MQNDRQKEVAKRIANLDHKSFVYKPAYSGHYKEDILLVAFFLFVVLTIVFFALYAPKLYGLEPGDLCLGTRDPLSCDYLRSLITGI